MNNKNVNDRYLPLQNEKYPQGGGSAYIENH